MSGSSLLARVLHEGSKIQGVSEDNFLGRNPSKFKYSYWRQIYSAFPLVEIFFLIETMKWAFSVVLTADNMITGHIKRGEKKGNRIGKWERRCEGNGTQRIKKKKGWGAIKWEYKNKKEKKKGIGCVCAHTHTHTHTTPTVSSRSQQYMNSMLPLIYFSLLQLLKDRKPSLQLTNFVS